MFLYKPNFFHSHPLKKMQKTRRPLGILDGKDVSWIRGSFWAAGNSDGSACQGLRNAPYFRDAFYNASLYFEPRTCLETQVYPGVFSPKEALRLHDMGVLPLLRKIALYKLKNSISTQDTPNFLLQVFSCETTPYSLHFEITDDSGPIFRETVTLYPGYNQRCLQLPGLLPAKGALRARFVSAEENAATLVFLFCEFVQLRSRAKPLIYPAYPIQVPPAEKVLCTVWSLETMTIAADGKPLSLRPGLRETLEVLDQRGILQVATGKMETEVLSTLLETLGICHYFVATFGNWNNQCQNLRDAGDGLTLDLARFGLIDDSPGAQQDVRENLPMVRLYDTWEGLPERQEFSLPVTEHSRRVRQMYLEDIRRKEAASRFRGGQQAFLRFCQLEGRLCTPTDQAQLCRSLELLAPDSQLTLSGNQYLPEDFFAHVQARDRDCYILTCADRFGSYGQVAYLEVCATEDVLTVTEFAMSRSVAGKYVEAALMDALFRRYPQANTIRLLGKLTGRNGLLHSCLAHHGFQEDRKGLSFSFSVAKSNLCNCDFIKIHFYNDLQ